MSSPGLEPCDYDEIIREEVPQAARLAYYFKYNVCLDNEKYSVLDVGCGPGIYVAEMRYLGIEAFGVDDDERVPKEVCFAREDVTSDKRPQFDADVVLSLEVGEHIPAEKASSYVKYITSTVADRVYFSAARPGQGGRGHINCQLKWYWIEKFGERGYYVDVEETERWLGFMRQGYHMGWLVQNGIVFRNG